MLDIHILDSSLSKKCMKIIEERTNNNNIGYIGSEYLIELFKNLTEDNLEETAQVIIDEANRIANSNQ
jgi:hypothetical protein